MSGIGTFACIVALLLSGPAVFGSGSQKIEAPPATETQSPDEQAMRAYNEGVDYRDEAWKLTGKLDAAAPDKHEQYQTKIRRAYDNAIRSFRRAIEYNPRLHQAHASLGYAYRQTGDYTAALAAYDQALAIAPNYVEAVEYRGEAYLGLGRIDDAKAAWEALQQKKSPLEAELLSAMHAWVAQRRKAPGELGVGTLDAFERWIDERQAGRPPATSSLKKW